MKRRAVLVHVTDHAVLRFLERAHGLDVEGVRRRLERGAQNAAELKASAVVVANVRMMLAENGPGEDGQALVTVTTCLLPSQTATRNRSGE